MTLPRARRGEPVRAANWNQLAAAAESTVTIQGGKGLNVSQTPSGSTVNTVDPLTRRRDGIISRAANVDDETIDAHSPVVIVGQAFDADNADLFGPIVLQVRKPEGSDDEDSAWAVTVNAIEPGIVGRVCVMGVCLVSIKAQSGGEDGTFVRLDPNVATDALRIDDEGDGQMLWRDDSASITSKHLALVRFPVGAGGGSAPEIELSDDPPPPCGAISLAGGSNKAMRSDAVAAVHWLANGDGPF